MTNKQMTKPRVPNGIHKTAAARELGVVNRARFIRLFDSGKGNYTREREALLAGTTIDDILSEVAKLNEERAKAARKTPASKKPTPSRKVKAAPSRKATAKTAAPRKASKRLAHA